MRRRRLATAVLGIAVALSPALANPAGAQTAATVALRASRGGFQPSVVRLRRGEAVHVVLSSADREHCFAVDELRIEKRIVPGRETRFDLTPERAGTFAFYCCLESGESVRAERGELIVED